MRYFLSYFLLLPLWVLQASLALGETEAVFSPEKSIREILLKEVESATSTIDLAVREITPAAVPPPAGWPWMNALAFGRDVAPLGR